MSTRHEVGCQGTWLGSTMGIDVRFAFPQNWTKVYRAPSQGPRGEGFERCDVETALQCATLEIDTIARATESKQREMPWIFDETWALFAGAVQSPCAAPSFLFQSG